MQIQFLIIHDKQRIGEKMRHNETYKKLNKKEFSNLGFKKICYLRIEDAPDDEENFILYNADGTIFAQRYSMQSALDVLDAYGMTLAKLQ